MFVAIFIKSMTGIFKISTNEISARNIAKTRLERSREIWGMGLITDSIFQSSF